MPLVEQGDHSVDHGEPRADHQDRAFEIEVGESVGRPGVGAVEIGVVETGIGERRRFRREIADCQNGDIGAQCPAAVEMEDDLVPVMLDPLRITAQQLQLHRLRRCLDFLVQQMAHIIAENLAGNKATLAHGTGDR